MSDSLPVFIQVLSDFRELVKEYGQSLQAKWGDDKIWVWDSAMYSEKNLKAISEDYVWITRVPETITEAKDVLEHADMATMRSTALNGYRIVTTEVEYGGVKQRWVVVFSENAFARETKRKKKDGGRRRPRKDEPTQIFYRVKIALAERTLREALEKGGGTIPDQKGKPTKKPTIRRVFQVFEGITVLYRGSEMVKVLNMKPIHLKILSLLGHEYERMYCTGYW